MKVGLTRINCLHQRRLINIEARITKFETNSNDQNSKPKRRKYYKFGEFGHLNLGFISSFDIRISDFSRLSLTLVAYDHYDERCLA
jgi:hypothetical protein